MEPYSNFRVYDVSTRLAVYVEQANSWQVREFNRTVEKMARELIELVGRQEFRDLGQLPKTKLMQILAKLRKMQKGIYSQYLKNFLRWLQEFTAADLAVNRIVWATTADEVSQTEVFDEPPSDESATFFLIPFFKSAGKPYLNYNALIGDGSEAYSQILTKPIPANGAYVKPFLATFFVNAMAAIENAVVAAWANKKNSKELIEELVGAGPAAVNKGSLFSRVKAQGNSVISTITSHASSIIATSVQAALFYEYIWHSVMDSATTKICIDRNLKKYIYGKGPLPPGHVACRSHVAPFFKDGIVPKENFLAWIKRQPMRVKRAILGESGLSLLESGKLTADEVVRFTAPNALSVDGLKNKIDEILSR